MTPSSFSIPILYFYQITVTWLKSASGKENALLGGYTFYCATRTTKSLSWLCTSSGGHGRRCKARFSTTPDKDMVRMQTEHNHPAPLYIIRDGVYFKIWLVYCKYWCSCSSCKVAAAVPCRARFFALLVGISILSF